MSISSDTLRGHTDTIILTQLMRGDNYGYEINKTIQQRTGGQYGFKDHLLLGRGGPRGPAAVLRHHGGGPDEVGGELPGVAEHKGPAGRPDFFGGVNVMDKMKTRFIIAVTGRLAQAEETTAKVELIEELSDNLYSRWQDLVASGVPEEEAYTRALEDLGNVDELPDREGSVREFTNELLRGLEDVVRETVSQTRDAVDQAGIIVRNVAERIREKYPNGVQGRICVQVDKEGYEETPPRDTESGGETASQNGEKAGWSFAVGYDKERGFFCGSNSGRAASRRVTGTTLPSQEVKGVDVQVVNGDVTVHLSDDPQGDVILDGDVDHLEVRMSEEGVLSIRQGNTASSAFFFLRGLAAADVELTLPRRYWEFIQLSTVNGDLELDDGLEAGRLAVKAASGDVRFREARCGEVCFKSASGDLDAGGEIGSIQAETASGDVELSGSFGAVRAATASGDVEVQGSVREIRCSSASGDAKVRTQTLPDKLEISTKSGDCRLYLPAGEGFALQFSTVSGDLDTEFELVGPVGARSGEAVYLDGGGRSYRINSISGDISLRQN